MTISALTKELIYKLVVGVATEGASNPYEFHFPKNARGEVAGNSGWTTGIIQIDFGGQPQYINRFISMINESSSNKLSSIDAVASALITKGSNLKNLKPEDMATIQTWLNSKANQVKFFNAFEKPTMDSGIRKLSSIFQMQSFSSLSEYDQIVAASILEKLANQRPASIGSIQSYLKSNPDKIDPQSLLEYINTAKYTSGPQTGNYIFPSQVKAGIAEAMSSGEIFADIMNSKTLSPIYSQAITSQFDIGIAYQTYSGAIIATLISASWGKNTSGKIIPDQGKIDFINKLDLETGGTFYLGQHGYFIGRTNDGRLFAVNKDSKSTEYRSFIQNADGSWGSYNFNNPIIQKSKNNKWQLIALNDDNTQIALDIQDASSGSVLNTFAGPITLTANVEAFKFDQAGNLIQITSNSTLLTNGVTTVATTSTTYTATWLSGDNVGLLKTYTFDPTVNISNSQFLQAVLSIQDATLGGIKIGKYTSTSDDGNGHTTSSTSTPVISDSGQTVGYSVYTHYYNDGVLQYSSLANKFNDSSMNTVGYFDSNNQPLSAPPNTTGSTTEPAPSPGNTSVVADSPLLDILNSYANANWHTGSADINRLLTIIASTSFDESTQTWLAESDSISYSANITPDGNVITLTGNGGEKISAQLSGTTIVISDSDGTNIKLVLDSTATIIQSDTWSLFSGTTGKESIDNQRNISGTEVFLNGATAQYSEDQNGNIIIQYNTSQGFSYADSWSYADGSTGYENYIPSSTVLSSLGSKRSGVESSLTERLVNGSYSTQSLDDQQRGILINYNDDGSVSSTSSIYSDHYSLGQDGVSQVTSTDEHGNIKTQYLDKYSNIISDEWKNIDGTSGSDIYTASGMTIKNKTLTDGTSQTITTYAGNSTLDAYNTDGQLVTDTWALKNGETGNSTFALSSNGSGSIQHENGSTSSIMYNLDGSIEVTNHDLDGHIYSVDTWNTNGDYSISLYHSGNKSVTYTYHTNGLLDVTNYADDGSVSDQLTANAGQLLIPDGTLFSKIRSQDGTYTVNYTDTNGDTLAFYYNSANKLLRTNAVQASSISLPRPSGAPQSAKLLTYTAITWTDTDGKKFTSYSDTQGHIVAIDYTAPDGSYGHEVKNSDGSIYGDKTQADGSHVEYNYDGLGNNVINSYNIAGNFIGDQWQKSDGSNGYDNYNADGSTFSKSINPDGSYSTFQNDGKQNTISFYFDKAGNKTADIWLSNDGSSGTDYFNSDGSRSGTKLYSDRTSISYSIDANGNSKYNHYDINGILTSYTWNNADGSYGSTTYFSDGSQTTHIQNANGTSIATAIDSIGNYIENDFDSSGNKVTSNWKNTDGSFGNASYNQDGSTSSMTHQSDGSYQITETDILGNSDAKYFDVNQILVTDHLTKNDGSEETTQYKSDGSTITTIKQYGGGYSTENNDGHGNITTDFYDSSNDHTGQQWSNSDGSHGTATFSLDGSSTSTIYSPDGSYTINTVSTEGVVARVDYNSENVKLSANWSDTTGSHGTYQLNPDGSSTETTYQSNGNYDINITDQNGNNVDRYYSSSGEFIYDKWHKTDGTSGADIVKDGEDSNSKYLTDTIYTTSHFSAQDGYIFDMSQSQMLHLSGIGNADRIINFFTGNGLSDGTSNIHLNTSIGYGGSLVGSSTIYQPNGNYNTSISFGDPSGSGFYADDNSASLNNDPANISNKFLPFNNGINSYSTSTQTVNFHSTTTSDIPPGHWVLMQFHNSDLSMSPDDPGYSWFELRYVPDDPSLGSYIPELTYTTTTSYDKVWTVNYNFGTDGHYTGQNISHYKNDWQTSYSSSSYWTWSGGHGQTINGLTSVYLTDGEIYTSDLFTQKITTADGKTILSSSPGYYKYAPLNGAESIISTPNGGYWSDSAGNYVKYTYTYYENSDTNSYFVATKRLSSYSWGMADGSHGTFSYNLDGSGQGITYYNDGSTTKAFDDGAGGFSLKNYSTLGRLLSDKIGTQDGTIALDTFNSDGSSFGSAQYTDGSNSNYTDDGKGNKTTLTFTPTGFQSGDSWTKSDGSFGSDSYQEDGSSVRRVTVSDGSSSVITDDGQGNITTALFTNEGTEIGDHWSKFDGSTGNDVFNTDGSHSGQATYANGATSTSFDDGKGNIKTIFFNADGSKTNDSWEKSDGSKGIDTFNADGSSSGSVSYADGSSSTYSDDGHGTATRNTVDTNGKLIASTTTASDGSTSSAKYYANGDFISTATTPNGLITSVTKELGRLVSYSNTNATDGSHVNIAYASNSDTLEQDHMGDGTERFAGNAGSNNQFETTISQEGKVLASQWNATDGSRGSINFSSDGSWVSTNYLSNGEAIQYQSDNHNRVTMALVDANGQVVNSSLEDRTPIQSQLVGDDGLGNILTNQYDAAGNVVGDTWSHADGTTGSDVFLANGASFVTVIASDGSSGVTYDDGHGNTETSVYGTDGHFLSASDKYTVQSGSGSTATLSIDQSGTALFNLQQQGLSQLETYKLDGTVIIASNNSSWGVNDTYQINPDHTSIDTEIAYGATVTTSYNANGQQTAKHSLSDSGYWQNEVTTFNADGTYIIDHTDSTNHEAWNTMSADGMRTLSSRWQDTTGDYGSTAYQPDGSSSSTDYYVATGQTSTSSYNASTRVSQFLTTDSNGNIIQSATYNPDGSYTTGGLAWDGSGNTYNSVGDSNQAESDTFTPQGVEISQDFTINSNMVQTTLTMASGVKDTLGLWFAKNDQLWFQQSGSDLLISQIGSSGSIDISGWYADGANQSLTINTNGASLEGSQINILVQAMAAFAPPSAGQTVLPDDYQASLQPVIASTWKSATV